MSLHDLPGRSFGRLTVTGLARRDGKHTFWCVQCRCGQDKDVRADHLVSGLVLSCGCYHSQISSRRSSKPIPAGTRYGRLVVLRRLRSIPKRGHVYLARCVCGRVIEVQGRHLRSGESKSCGCWYRDSRPLCGLKHGKSPAKNVSPVYSAYHRERRWCNDRRDKAYPWYGGRGVQFQFDSFESFFAEVGPKPEGNYWLMRIDGGDSDFEPGNMAWVEKRRHKRKRSKEVINAKR